jgi:hypothetical protein
VGLSIRYAQSRGLHLINDSPEVTDSEKEVEIRVWHATCSLERLLGFLTGRSIAIQDKHSSQRFPRPVQNQIVLEQLVGSSLRADLIPWFASSTLITSFCASLELDQICSGVLSRLYSANTVNLSWAQVQKLIIQFNHRLGKWRSRLSSTLTMDETANLDTKAPIPERMHLALRYFSISMLINRPCLCIGHEDGSTLPAQSSESKHRDHNFAVRCVASTRALIKLLPDHPDIVNLYTVTPWWCVLHYVVQAGAVIILEISLRSVHIQRAAGNILQDAEKVLKCLKAMSRTSIPAFRAWTAISRLLQLALSRVEEDIGALCEFLPVNTSSPITTEGFMSFSLDPTASSSTQLMTGNLQPHQLHVQLEQRPEQTRQQHQLPRFTPAPEPSLHLENPPDFASVYIPSLPAHDFWYPQAYSTATTHPISTTQMQPQADVSAHFPGGSNVADLVNEQSDE